MWQINSDEEKRRPERLHDLRANSEKV